MNSGFGGRWKSMHSGLVYENGADDPPAYEELEEITCG
jgi:hypothetical protein